MITGIIQRTKSPDASISPEKSIREIYQRLDGTSLFSSATYAFAHKSPQALSNYTGVISSQEYISFLCGEPYLSNSGAAADHQSLLNDVKRGRWTSLKSARGAFIFVFHDIEKKTTHLVSDKLGIRPIYYWISEKLFAFSTRFKCLMALDFVPKQRCERALSETVTFSYPLSNRTCAKYVAVLDAGEILTVSSDTVSTERYWRWDTIAEQTIPLDAAIQTAKDLFVDSIRLRLGSDVSTGAFLSGGMDSRAIVAILARLGIKTSLFNFSPSKSQDLAFASLFADKIGFTMISSPRDQPLRRGFRLRLAELTSNHIKENNFTFNRPRALWSGDGGSVGLGCVHLDQPMVDAMRDGKEDEALRIFCRKNYFQLPINFFQSAKKLEYCHFAVESIKNQIRSYSCQDPANKLFLFLMLNDQRRHLYDFFEEIEEHKLEYQLPFYDSSFLEFIYSLPLDCRLNHRFYHEWFKTLGPAVTTVPWQTYPGHEPCPLQGSEKLSYQWAKDIKKPLRERLMAGWDGLKIGATCQDIGPLSRPHLLGASALHALGIKNLNYVINAASVYCGPLRAC